jgi:hypothetical protein
VASVGFQQLQAQVLGFYALGLAEYSMDSSLELNERRRCIDEAQTYLDRAQTLFHSLPSKGAQNWVQPDLEQARAEVSAAKAKLEGAAKRKTNP